MFSIPNYSNTNGMYLLNERVRFYNFCFITQEGKDIALLILEIFSETLKSNNKNS